MNRSVLQIAKQNLQTLEQPSNLLIVLPGVDRSFAVVKALTCQTDCTGEAGSVASRTPCRQIAIDSLQGRKEGEEKEGRGRNVREQACMGTMGI